MKKIIFTGLLIGMFMFGMVLMANASTLTSVISMDNGYQVFISTSDSSAGASFGANNNWYSAYTDSTTLVDGVDYYLHVYGYDQGGPAGFLGNFTLTGTDHIFSNGLSTLATNTTDWQGNNTGWGSPSIALIDAGANDGTSAIWTVVSGISPTTHRIWAGDLYNNDVAFFSTRISSRSGSNTVPEPTSMLLFGLGMIGLAAVKRKFKK